MITYQDLLECVSESDIQEFVYKTIQRHKSSDVYKNSQIARRYFNCHNVTIEEYQKILYTLGGQAVPDLISPNNKSKNNIFHIVLTQQVQFLLGNGIVWKGGKQNEKLGKKYEKQMQKAAKESLIGGVSFVFFNFDHIEVFNAEEYIPLYDEIDGSMKAGIRHWQIDQSKPLRATLYEMDGYTEYIWKEGQCEILKEKRPYIISYKQSDAEGIEIYGGENYESFPIVQFYGQESKESALTGHREDIDSYDLIKSGYANDLDEASQIYWLVQNAGGMDEVDLVNFLNQIRRVKAAVVDEDGAKAEPHTIDIPHEARESLLKRLEDDLFRDFMAFDPRRIASGTATATEIKAGYELLNSKEDEFETLVTDNIEGVLKLAGIDDEPSYTRSMIVNRNEEVQMVLSAASYLPDDYVTKKILTILGDADMVEEILKQMEADELERMSINERRSGNEGDGQEAEESGEEGQGNV